MIAGNMRVYSIASGSSGNSILVIAGNTTLLVDSGLPTKQMEANLASIGVSPRTVDTILITHEHSDHIRSAGVMSRRYGIPLAGNSPTFNGASGYLGKVDWHTVEPAQATTIGEADVYAFPVSHDAACTMGYMIRHGSSSVCIATDIGVVTPDATEPMEASDLLILESNHDVEWLKRGPYPAFLKRRIMSNKGHLSNVDAAETVLGLSRNKYRWLWLTHLSQVNNSPTLAYQCLTDALQAGGVDNIELKVAKRDRPSLFWDSDNSYRQLGFALEENGWGAAR